MGLALAVLATPGYIPAYWCLTVTVHDTCSQDHVQLAYTVILCCLGQGRHVVISLDDSVHSQYALSWASSHLLRAGDTVTCLTVALPVPYPVSVSSPAPSQLITTAAWADNLCNLLAHPAVHLLHHECMSVSHCCRLLQYSAGCAAAVMYLGMCCCALLQILDETSVAIAALEAQQWAASNERSMEYAATCAGKAAAALAGSAPDGVTARAEAVPPAGGASDVGAALCAYAEEHKVGKELSG